MGNGQRASGLRSDHAEALAALVDGPQQRAHEMLVGLVVGQAQLVEARVRRRQRAERGRRRYLEARVQLLQTDTVIICKDHFEASRN